MAGITEPHARTIVQLMRANEAHAKALGRLWETDPEKFGTTEAGARGIQEYEASAWGQAAKIVEQAIDEGRP